MSNVNVTSNSFIWVISEEVQHAISFERVRNDTLEFLSDAAKAAGGYSQLDWPLLAMLVRGNYNNGICFLNAGVMFDFMADRFEWDEEIVQEEKERFEKIKANMNWMPINGLENVFTMIYEYELPREYCPDLPTRLCQKERVW